MNTQRYPIGDILIYLLYLGSMFRPYVVIFRTKIDIKYIACMLKICKIMYEVIEASVLKNKNLKAFHFSICYVGTGVYYYIGYD
jgi:hypothetical protein